MAVHGRGKILEQSTLPYRMIKLICVIIRLKNPWQRIPKQLECDQVTQLLYSATFVETFLCETNRSWFCWHPCSKWIVLKNVMKVTSYITWIFIFRDMLVSTFVHLHTKQTSHCKRSCVIDFMIMRVFMMRWRALQIYFNSDGKLVALMNNQKWRMDTKDTVQLLVSNGLQLD